MGNPSKLYKKLPNIIHSRQISRQTNTSTTPVNKKNELNGTNKSRTIKNCYNLKAIFSNRNAKANFKTAAKNKNSTLFFDRKSRSSFLSGKN